MGTRQPEDVPLTRFTDHKIARRPQLGRGVDLAEYTGRVRLYWPPGAGSPLYEALVNRSEWPRLTRRPPAEPEALLMLAEATKSAELYERALQAAPGLFSAWRGLALLRFPDLQVMRRGLAARPSGPLLLT